MNSEILHVYEIMVRNNDLIGNVQASMDEPTKTIVLHRTEPTRLQSMLLQLSDKVYKQDSSNNKLIYMNSAHELMLLQINILRETSDRTIETKIQGGPGTLGPGGKGRQFGRADWQKNRRQQQQNQNPSTAAL